LIGLNGKLGYINQAGNNVIPPMYDAGSKFVDGLAQVERNGKVFFIDNKGTEYLEQ